MDERIALRRERQKLYRRKYRELQAFRKKYAAYFEDDSLSDSSQSQAEEFVPPVESPENFVVESESESASESDVQGSDNEDYYETTVSDSSEEELTDDELEALEPAEQDQVNNEAGVAINIEPIEEDPEINEIRQWAITNRIKQNALDALLSILRRRLIPTLPKTSKTLLKTSEAYYDIRPMDDSKGLPAEYVYIGIQKQLIRHINPEFHEVDDTGMKLVLIDINIDGLKVFKSSKRDAWVISGRIVARGYGLYKPFTIAVYYGHGKPANFNLFLTDFVREIAKLSGRRGPAFGDGFSFSGHNYRVEVRFFICDTPARSAIKAIKGHTGFYSCERCIVRGKRQNNHTIFPPNDQDDGYYCKRTCDSFRMYDDNNHHTDVSLITAIRGLDPVNNFILDPMHLLYEGIMKRLFEYWFGEVNNDGKLSSAQKRELNRRSAMIKEDIPIEFHRKMRSTEQFKSMKGTEFKFFLDYASPILVQGLLKDDQFKNFVYLHVATRLLCAPNAVDNVDQARIFYKKFYRDCASFYGEDFLSLNVHSLDHIADDVENSRCNLNEIGAWPFENHLFHFKQSVTNPNRVLAQYCRRQHSESQILDHRPTHPVVTEVLQEQDRGIIKKYKYNNHIFTTKHPDNTAYLRTLRTLRVVQIKEIFRDCNGEVCATIRDYKVLNSAFQFHANPDDVNDLGLDSRTLNYVEIRTNNATEDRVISFSKISKKMVKFNINYAPDLPIRSFVVPLIH